MGDTNVDVNQALKDTENSLRDFVSDALHKKLGDNWIENCGVSADRLEKWKERKEAEKKRQESGVVEERLIYYADFYDLRRILKEHWSDTFSEVFGDWKTMSVWLKELEKLRDPNAHNRELLPHQKYLVLGLSGEIRTRLVRYRSKKDTSEDYYPRIESVRDNLGNIYVYSGAPWKIVTTDMILRVGDCLQFVVTATDPLGDQLQYRIFELHHVSEWRDNNTFEFTLENRHVGKLSIVRIQIQSPRPFHAGQLCDDEVNFHYEVLPPKRT